MGIIVLVKDDEIAVPVILRGKVDSQAAEFQNRLCKPQLAAASPAMPYVLECGKTIGLGKSNSSTCCS